MKCDVCNGHGWIENKRYYQYSSAEAYERGIQRRLNASDVVVVVS